MKVIVSLTVDSAAVAAAVTAAVAVAAAIAEEFIIAALAVTRCWGVVVVVADYDPSRPWRSDPQSSV